MHALVVPPAEGAVQSGSRTPRGADVRGLDGEIESNEREVLLARGKFVDP